jgi:plastocyanin
VEASATPAVPAADAGAPAAGSVQVGIESYGYVPEPIMIPAGGTVVWTNRDIVLHSATASDGSFESGLLQQGKGFAHTFSQPGEYPYYCTRHGGMAGLVIVVP